MIAGSRVESAAVVPDSYNHSSVKIHFKSCREREREVENLTKISCILPVKPNLQILVIEHESRDFFHDLVRLCVSHIVDGQAVGAPAEQALPPGQWVGADQWVLALELETHVAGGAARA
jgi:hypothetical protein